LLARACGVAFGKAGGFSANFNLTASTAVMACRLIQYQTQMTAQALLNQQGMSIMAMAFDDHWGFCADPTVAAAAMRVKGTAKQED